MKLETSKTVHYESGPNMTPLVDVVMVILIFLMLAGSFAQNEHYLVSPTAIVSRSVDGPAGKEAMDPPVEILVDAPRPDQVVMRVGDVRVTSASELTRELSRKHAGLQAVGSVTDKTRVIICPSAAVKYQILVDVYQSAMDAKFTKISFAPSR